MSFDPSSDYPLGANRPDLVRTPGGIALDELELDGAGVVSAELRATPETLRLQADVAELVGDADAFPRLDRLRWLPAQVAHRRRAERDALEDGHARDLRGDAGDEAVGGLDGVVDGRVRHRGGGESGARQGGAQGWSTGRH